MLTCNAWSFPGAQIGRIVRHETVNEGVRVLRETEKRAADVLDEEDVPPAVRMNPFEAALAHAAVESPQSRGLSGARSNSLLSSITPPVFPRSWVKSMVFENGSQMEPSMLLKCVSPSAPGGVRSVTR